MARAIAGEANVPFFTISGSDFVEMFVGVGASRVRDMFEQAKKNAPCIIFIDEIDAVGRHRGAGLGGGNDEREQTLNQLLVEMDGFEANEGIILIAATNRPDVLDPALLRPGRFDRQVVVPNPDVVGREQILKVHVRKVPLAPDVVLKTIARGTPGFSGADLMNLVNEAALMAARRNKRMVTQVEFEDAKDKVMMGAERKSLVMTEEEKLLTAYHEGGHAIVALNVKATDPVHKATIIPRGRALGMVMQLPERDKLSMSLEQMTSRLAIMMGGRVAEELVFGRERVTSGAASDIEQATKLARMMVTRWGLSEALGTVAYGENQEEVFLGYSVARQQNISEATVQKIDAEIRRLVEDGYKEAQQILTEKRADLETLAKGLLEFETLTGDEIKDLIMGKRPVRESVIEPTTPRTRPCRRPAPAATGRAPSRPDGAAAAGLKPLRRAARLTVGRRIHAAISLPASRLRSAAVRRWRKPAAPVAKPLPSNPILATAAATPRRRRNCARPRSSRCRRIRFSTTARIQRIKEALLSYSDIQVRGGWPALPRRRQACAGSERSRGRAAAPASRHQRRHGRRARNAGDAYDDDVAEAVKRFQLRHGLDATGSVGAQTLKALNVPVGDRIKQLEASLERLLGMDFIFAERYVVVNIPAAFVEAVANGKVERRYRVIVGKIDKPSPTLTRLHHRGRSQSDLDGAALDHQERDHGAHAPGSELSQPACICASSARTTRRSIPRPSIGRRDRSPNFTVRQDAGTWNALGYLKIDMPNPYRSICTTPIRESCSPTIIASIRTAARASTMCAISPPGSCRTVRRAGIAPRSTPALPRASARSSICRTKFRSPGSISPAG